MSSRQLAIRTERPGSTHLHWNQSVSWSSVRLQAPRSHFRAVLVFVLQKWSCWRHCSCIIPLFNGSRSFLYILLLVSTSATTAVGVCLLSNDISSLCQSWCRQSVLSCWVGGVRLRSLPSVLISSSVVLVSCQWRSRAPRRRRSRPTSAPSRPTTKPNSVGG